MTWKFITKVRKTEVHNQSSQYMQSHQPKFIIQTLNRTLKRHNKNLNINGLIQTPPSAETHNFPLSCFFLHLVRHLNHLIPQTPELIPHQLRMFVEVSTVICMAFDYTHQLLRDQSKMDVQVAETLFGVLRVVTFILINLPHDIVLIFRVVVQSLLPRFPNTIKIKKHI